MISNQEKELMMVMKFMADHTSEFAEELSSVQNDSINNGKRGNRLPEADTYSDIVRIAKESGYDTNVLFEDLLSKAELKELKERYAEIEKEFAEKTKLNKTDITFVFVAVALQMVRQVFQPSVSFDAFVSGKDRQGNKETAKDAKDKIDKDKLDKQKKKAEDDKTKGSRYYHASVAEIANLGYTSYDLTESGKYKFLKLGGSNHRYKTLGHDPWLGYFFGTLNILTNTVTMGKENLFKSYHVGRSNKKHIIPIAEADMTKIIEYGFNRFRESKATVGLAIAHQAYHINSDKLSHDGLPLPFLELFCDSKFIDKLIDCGFDYARLEFLGNVGKQTIFAEIINYVISVAHRFSIVYQERKSEVLNKDFNIEDFKEALLRQKTLDEVRTRKIILYSLCMATSANTLIIGATEYAAFKSGNVALAKKALEKIDLGGYLSSIIHLFMDERFILKMKKDFCAQIIESDFQKQLQELGIN